MEEPTHQRPRGAELLFWFDVWSPPTTLAQHETDSGSQSHTTRRGRASCDLCYAPVANVYDLLLFLDENRVIPEFRHF